MGSMILALLLSGAAVVVSVMMIVKCVKWMLEFLADPLVKAFAIFILGVTAYVTLSSLEEGFDWTYLLVGVVCIALCVGLLFLKGPKKSYRSRRNNQRDYMDFDYDDDDDEIPIRKPERKRNTYEDQNSYGWGQAEESSGYSYSHMEELRRQQEELERREEKRQEKIREAAMRRGRPVAGGACPYLYERENGYYDGWKRYRCDISGAEFESGYKQQNCDYPRTYEKCRYNCDHY